MKRAGRLVSFLRATSGPDSLSLSPARNRRGELPRRCGVLVTTLAFAALALAPSAGACSTGDPAWSPDGRRIAFAGSSDLKTGWTIQLVDPVGTEVKPMTRKPADDPPFRVWTHDFEPTWSPDGALLAYESGFEFWNTGYSHPLDSWEISVLTISNGTVRPVGQGLDSEGRRRGNWPGALSRALTTTPAASSQVR